MGCCLFTWNWSGTIRMEPILTSDKIQTLGSYLQKQNKRIVLVGGCFDILHIGHISLLESAKKLGDILVVFLESDETIKFQKGANRPLHTQLQRATVLKAMRDVDYIVLLKPHMTNEHYDKLTNALKPAIIATTENDPGIVHKQRQANQIGANIVFATKPIQDVSTSKIVTALHNEL